MARLPIVIYPDPLLKQPTEAVTAFDAELHRFLDDMVETMYAANGVGLASPQVGRLKQVTVIDVSDDKRGKIELINPLILEASGKVSSEEGCLSIPDFRETLSRNEKVKVRAQDRDGKEFELEADGLLAICLQHEIDHLNGVLFVDRLSRLKREMFKRWAKKRFAPAGSPERT